VDSQVRRPRVEFGPSPHFLSIVALGGALLYLALAPAFAHAAIEFVGTASGENGGGNANLSIAKPTGVVEGGVMVATVTAAGTGSITTPSGWTVIKNVAGTALRQVTYYKVAGASEAASYSWSLGSSRAASGGIVDYRGVNQTVPVDATASATGESGNAAVPSVTTSAANDLVLSAASFATKTTVTPDAATIKRFDVASSSNTSEVADFAQATAGATAAVTVTPAVSSAAWIAQAIALRDASQATLSATTTAAPSFSASLNSGDQAKTFTVPLTVSDTRTGASAGLGWNTTSTSTQFTTGAKTLPATASTITAVSSACANGGLCTNPTSSIAYPLVVPAGSVPPTAVKFYSAAAATGKGVFTVTPTVSVAVPQNSFTGTYTSTLTIAIVSGP
jgi:hypothetical protein